MPPHDGPGIELAILYSDRQSAESLLARATKMCAGLDPSIVLIAVHTVPYPCNFECPSATHAHLVNVLSELAQGCPARATAGRAGAEPAGRAAIRAALRLRSHGEL
jgi:hypothetical protein